MGYFIGLYGAAARRTEGRPSRTIPASAYNGDGSDPRVICCFAPNELQTSQSVAVSAITGNASDDAQPRNRVELVPGPDRSTDVGIGNYVPWPKP